MLRNPRGSPGGELDQNIKVLANFMCEIVRFDLYYPQLLTDVDPRLRSTRTGDAAPPLAMPIRLVGGRVPLAHGATSSWLPMDRLATGDGRAVSWQLAGR